MTAPSWAPDLAWVGAYVTSRTLSGSDIGSDTPTGTFDGTTWPTAAAVNALIGDACAWVTTLTGPIPAELFDQAAAVAALRSAAMVEMSYPVRDADVTSTAAVLLEQANRARDELVTAMTYATGTAPTLAATALPSYSFPDPSWFGDRNL